jgi:hypothetical protein
MLAARDWAAAINIPWHSSAENAALADKVSVSHLTVTEINGWIDEFD